MSIFFSEKTALREHAFLISERLPDLSKPRFLAPKRGLLGKLPFYKLMQNA